ncbi:MAG: ABC transporter ATP-binding protein [Streptosporangiaceae bacterium]
MTQQVTDTREREAELRRLPEEGSCAVRLTSVSMSYSSKEGTTDVLKDLSLDIRQGDFVSLVGRSGYGKSTLLSLIGGLAKATGGEIEVEGHRVKGPQTQLGFVFQVPTLLGWRSALDNVMLQAEAKGLSRKDALGRASQLLKAVGLDGFMDRRPGELSGGMQQRVGVCRALLHDPSILLMDEPFSALDEITRDDMNVQLQALWLSDVRTVLFVTHSIREAAFLSDRVIVLAGRPASVVCDLNIDLPRPRTLEMREESQFGRYVLEVRNAL